MAIENDRQEIDFAIRTSVTDATSAIRSDRPYFSKNINMDGSLKGSSDFVVDKKAALKIFKESLYLNCSKDLIAIENLPVLGVVSFDGIELYVGGHWLLKENFLYTSGNKLYELTLSELVKVTDLRTRIRTGTTLSTIGQVEGFSGEDFRDYVIMKTIFEKINEALISQANLQTQSEGYGLALLPWHLDKIDHHGKSNYNYTGSVIEGPCFIAVVDQVSMGLLGQKKYRTIEIGAAELKLKN